MAARRPERGGWWYDDNVVMGWLAERARLVGVALGSYARRRRRHRRRMYSDEATFRAAYGAACARLVAVDVALTAEAVAAAMEPWCSARTLERRVAEWQLPAPAQMEATIRAQRHAR